MTYFKSIFFLGLSLVFFSSFSQPIVLADQGKTVYSIIMDEPVTMTPVVNNFVNYFKKITQAEIPVYYGSGHDFSFIKFTYLSSVSIGNIDISADGFIIKTESSNLEFKAYNARGLNNAITFFFEKYADVHCYSVDALVFQKKNMFAIPQINSTETPSFTYRTTNNYNAYYEPFNTWNRLSNALYDEQNMKRDVSHEWGLYVHTMHKLVPPETYFKEHPEYYSLRGDHRTQDQLCLSNPEVLRITIESLKTLMAKNPVAQYWSVSQMDNFNYCQCPHCRAVDSIEGSPAGSIIRFVNKVAAAFPDKTISTLAYQYSRKAPAITKPLPNVNIMLCTIECDRSKPLACDTGNGSFASDIKTWAKISDNIMIWDYVVDFSHSLMPFPNFQVMQPNLKFFKDYHATMMFEQGFTTKNTDFSELRGYLLSSLMWNVNQNADSVINEFLRGYYGKAAPFVRQYIDLMTAGLIKSGKSLTLYEPPSQHKNGYLSPENIRLYFALLNQGKKAIAGDTVLEVRIENLMQSVRYAYIEVCQMMPHTSDWIFEKNTLGNFQVKPEVTNMLSTLVTHANKYGPEIFCEMGCQPDVYYKEKSAYFNQGISASFNKIRSIKYDIKNSENYPAEGPNTLIDGVFGTNSYFSLWHGWWGTDVEVTLELKEAQIVNAVSLHCLNNPQSWIIAPSEMLVSLSGDGLHFNDAGIFKNTTAGINKEKTIDKYEVKTSLSTPVKFIRVRCKNYGKMPVWTGVVNGDTWIFVDEIEIH
jgi:hypothetical protein